MNSIGASYEPDASGVAPKQMDTIPFLTLNDGNKIPMFGFGLGTAHEKQDTNSRDKKLIELTKKVMEMGYRHLDCAEVYGNEEELGESIKACKVPRQKLYITTQHPGHPDQPIQDALAASLERLQLDYVDLYLIHCPFHAPSKEDLQRMWGEMEAVRASGQARSVGVANFLQEHLETILESGNVTPAVNQIEFHPYLQRGGLIDFHRRRGIATVAYGPLASIARKVEGPVDELWGRLAYKYGVTESEIALRWCIDQGLVVITTSNNERRLQAYLSNLPAIKLTPKEVREVADTGKEKHFRAHWTHIFSRDDKR